MNNTTPKDTFYNNVFSLLNHTNSSTLEELNTVPKTQNTTLIKRSSIPDSHRMIADNLMIIKKVFKHPVVQCKLISQEIELLAKYDFNPLEFSTSKQIEEELTLLKKWSNSGETELQEMSDKIITIRGKELRNLMATRYIYITSEIYNGHKTLEKYFENISKYNLER